MLLLAPSTEKELTIGGLDILKLNSWLNTAQKIENESIDSKGNKIVNSENYFSYLSKVFEEYKIVILSAINSSDFDENMSGIEDEKMGDEWNAMMIAEEKNEGVKRETDNSFFDDTRDPRGRSDYLGKYIYNYFIHFIFILNCSMFFIIYTIVFVVNNFLFLILYFNFCSIFVQFINLLIN